MTESNEYEATFEYVGFGYTLDKAVPLMHQEVMYIRDLNQTKTLENTGLVSGILHLNEEIELVVQFYEGIKQFTQKEFEAEQVNIYEECDHYFAFDATAKSHVYLSIFLVALGGVFQILAAL